MHRYILGFVFVAALLLASHAGAQTLSLSNGDFEWDSPVVSPPSGWTLDEGKVYVTSGSNLSPIDPTSAFSGSNFATMNRLATGETFPDPAQTMSMYQTVDVSAFSSAIDVGDRFVDLSFAYNAADPSDNGVVSIDFLDSVSSPLGDAVSFETIYQPTPSSVWATHSLYGHVPVGTRAIQFSLAGERIGGGVGTARNVAFDGLTAQLIDEPPVTPRDVVHGNLVQFADNGAWCWFQDERAIVDQQKGELVVGYIANRNGVGGEAVDGHVKTTHFNLATGLRQHYFHNDIESYGAGDDHNVPGLLQKNDGDILAFYAAHNNRDGVEDDRSYYRTYDPDTQSWGIESEYHWWDAIPSNAPGSGGTTYSNVFQLSAEDSDGDGNGRLYNIARTQQSPHIMYSDDNGVTWEYGGQLTKQASDPPSSSYVNGYYKYTSNGIDRIDLIATEFHPRDYNTSIYHAYIQNGKLYDSDGNEIDNDIFDAATSFDANNVTSTDDFTQIFQAGTTSDSRAWNSDVQSYPDGSISVLFKARAGAFSSHTTGADDHRVWFARFDPNTTDWTVTQIAEAGAQLFPGNETDYTGLGALHPNDPNMIYISTEVDPISGGALAHHEIYKGVTANNGLNWTWTAVTENSSYDNLRPIIPAWDANNTAVLWWRGSMSSSQSYDTAVVGIIDRGDEDLGPVTYVDASLANTTLADGSPATFTGPASTAGAADGYWHQRTGVGNGSDVFTADDSGAEDAPMLKTTISDLGAGIYDVFAFFWCDINQDWQIQAGLAADDMMLFRRRGSQQAEADQFDVAPLLDYGTLSLYRAYVGRVDIAFGELVDVFIDDSTGSGTQSVWYDGLGFASVVSTLMLAGDYNDDGIVDAADYTVWRDNLGTSEVLPNDLIGGTITEAQYDQWRAHFGQSAASGASAAFGGQVAVPEPSTLLLVACALSLCLLRPIRGA